VEGGLASEGGEAREGAVAATRRLGGMSESSGRLR